jgi:hypothetical protein
MWMAPNAFLLVDGLVAELGQEGRRGGGWDGAATATAGDGGDDLDPCDAGQKKFVGGGRIGQALNPSAADFREVTLDDAAGVEDERGHASAPLSDDRLREWFSVEGYWLEDRPRRGISGSGQARYATGFQQVLLEFRFGHPGACRHRRGVPAELLKGVADDVNFRRITSGKDLVMDKALQLWG